MAAVRCEYAGREIPCVTEPKGLLGFSDGMSTSVKLGVVGAVSYIAWRQTQSWWKTVLVGGVAAYALGVKR